MAKKVKKEQKSVLKIGNQEIPIAPEILEETVEGFMFRLLEDEAVYYKVSSVVADALIAYLKKNTKQFDSKFKETILVNIEDLLVEVIEEDASFEDHISDRIVKLRNEVFDEMSDKQIKALIKKKLSN